MSEIQPTTHMSENTASRLGNLIRLRGRLGRGAGVLALSLVLGGGEVGCSESGDGGTSPDAIATTAKPSQRAPESVPVKTPEVAGLKFDLPWSSTEQDKKGFAKDLQAKLKDIQRTGALLEGDPYADDDADPDTWTGAVVIATPEVYLDGPHSKIGIAVAPCTGDGQDIDFVLIEKDNWGTAVGSKGLATNRLRRGEKDSCASYFTVNGNEVTVRQTKSLGEPTVVGDPKYAKAPLL